MPQFLQLVAKDLVSQFGDNISNVTLVFPSRRAGLFFNTHLAKLIDKPIWSPKVATINELMQSISGFTVDDPINLVTKLYSIYCKVKGSVEPFENFYFWGEVMLADFDQIDKYLVDPKQLFSNIKDIKDIEEKFDGLTPEQTEALKNYLGVITGEQVSELRNNYLSVWGILHQIYNQLWEELELSKIAYEGMIYRKAAQILKDSNSTPTLPNPVAFIGFNALNECEKALFSRCKREGGALFYWDYDPVFVDNPEHEAGLFIRQNLQLFPNALPRELFENNNSSKIVKMVAAPSSVAQTKLTPRILDIMREAGAQLDVSTAIILPKENLLLPTLHAIPSSIDALNITMGYPIRETPAYSLAEMLVRLQSNAQLSNDGVLRFYHKDVIGILNHPYIRLCEPDQSSSITLSIKRSNRIYPKDTELTKSPFLKKIFLVPKNDVSITHYILEICNGIAQQISTKIGNNENPQLRIELEFLYALHKSLTRLGGVLKGQGVEITNKVFIQILRKTFNQERISFSGEPLAGLQIMGFLETRALDFENIIILSFNDDVLPGNNHPVSFVTPSLRVGFGLPDYKHHDAVYAYYFYRLLNRAKNVFLVYSGRTEGLSSGERSRYGLQLEMEQMIGKIQNINVGYNLSLTPPLPISIEKSSDVMDDLKKNLSRKGNGITLSPSGLTTYITCPLQFYFRYSLGLLEDEDITEEIGALEFGRIIHNSMEELYNDYNGKMVTATMVNTILSKPNFIEQTLDRVFSEVFLKDSSPEALSGRNLLARNAMLYTLKRMIKLDFERAPFHLVSHEQEVYVTLNNVAGISQIRLGGYVDRIEINGGSVWAIDYKTGRHNTYKGKFKSIDELFDPKKIDNSKEVFQTFCYCLALAQHHPQKPVKPALWFVKNAKSVSNFDIQYTENSKIQPVNDFRVFENDFSQGLSKILSEIFDPSIPFSQTTDIDKCKNCPYNGICVKG